MTNTELMFEGINLMFAGMGFVMLFLFLLIYAIQFSSKIINQFFPENAPASSPPKVQSNVSCADDMERLRPVIVAAIAHHRRQQGLK